MVVVNASFFRNCTLCASLLLQSFAHVWAQTCAIPGRDGPASIVGQVNTYYPPATNGTYNVGSTNIALGTSVGAANAASPGDLLLVIQMQCAIIETSNTNNYGGTNGTGRGYTDPAGSCAAGQYEYVRAAAGTTGSNLVLSTPLVNTYINDDTTATNRRTFQVIRIPQYAAIVLTGEITAPYWNGNTGGVVVLDVAGQLNWAGQMINAAGRGFRGGGGYTWTGTAEDGAQPDYVDTFANAVSQFKGEGIAGTPRLIYNTDLNTRTDQGATWGGYLGGDVARGAPGNAAGGANNFSGLRDNGGGGGGGNGGVGGFGGYGWANAGWPAGIAQDLRGIGGAAFAQRAANRIVMGGGGGAGGNNNSGNPPPVGMTDGGTGGGIVIIRAGSMAGDGTVTVAGRDSLTNAVNDGAGGAGAGGSIVLMSAAGSVGGAVNLVATGGKGGDSWLGGTTAHGGGGGGAGGVVITSGSPTINTGGGLNGTTNTGDNPADANHGASPGETGLGTTGAVDASFSTRGGALCLPNLTLSKTTLNPIVLVAGATTVTYQISVSNSGGMAIGADLVDNALPPGWTWASTTSVTFAPPLSATVWGGFVEGATPGVSAVVDAPGGVANFTTNGSPNTAPVWANMAVPGINAGTPGLMTLTFVANVPATAPVGCYHNPAGMRYLDPTRSTAGREITPLVNNASNRAGALVGGTTNTSYETAPGSTTTVGGSNYSGLQNGSSGEDVCLQGDLSITKTGPVIIAAGQTSTYVLTTNNAGRQIRDLTFAADQASIATNADTVTRILSLGTIRVTDTLPAGVTLNGAITPPAGWACSTVGQTITCDRTAPVVPITATTALGVINIPVRITNAACAGPITNTAVISGFQPPYVESAPGNNSQSALTTLNCNANLSVTKTNGTDTLVAGSTVNYTITYANVGPSSADGALISDLASPGLSSCSVLSCAPSGASVCPATFATYFGSGVTVPSLPAGGQLQVQVRCSVTASGQ